MIPDSPRTLARVVDDETLESVPEYLELFEMPGDVTEGVSIAMVRTAWALRARLLADADARIAGETPAKGDLPLRRALLLWAGRFYAFMTGEGAFLNRVFARPKGEKAKEGMTAEELCVVEWGGLWDEVFETIRLALLKAHYLSFKDPTCKLFFSEDNLLWVEEAGEKPVLVSSPAADTLSAFNARRRVLEHAASAQRMGTDMLAGWIV